MHMLPQLAREAVEHFVRSAQELNCPQIGYESFRLQQAGVFVTLQTPDKRLRGCIGTVSPTYPTVLDEIIQNAIAAATRDPRFLPVQLSELELLSYSVSLLHPPEAIADPLQLDPSRYGVIVVASRGRRGLLLPDLEGIDQSLQQIQIAMQKGGILPGENIQLYRFQVDKYT